ncbi:hypothetical protein Q4574_13490 [Aliiglaciecola sp. 3_MG-2023]|uniref:hypothetical protein n=1 Tax=Aliiglaciecola sp. 3_MG-2023 TaxID=3062644 RepID=UPI0026E20D0B|nr:hypothetical protein [Aliiglaciecola sp. 3_MG-2023]MDO6694302.1 hypothetical protein [Aliiglaciecola sp. 3_MG-2023]
MTREPEPPKPSPVTPNSDKQTAKIPANVRVMIALVASPTLMVIAFSIYCILIGNWQEPGVSGIIFSALGIFAYYVVLVGRLPTWFHFKRQKQQ